METQYNPTRRQLLSTVGVGMISPVVGKAVAKTGRKYIGVAYDTKSRRKYGSVDAKLSRKKGNGSLQGKLKINGKPIPIGQQEVTRGKEKGGKRNKIKSQSPHHSRKGPKTNRQQDVFRPGSKEITQPYLVNILSVSDGEAITGYITHPTPRFGKLGFTLLPSEQVDAKTKQALQKPLKAKKTSIMSQETKFPRIPTATGIARGHQRQGGKNDV
ncbi:hypothetical protein [Halorhabdus tiamatea]|nr:hypothetical protein [Halorhabdus tiamatea]